MLAGLLLHAVCQSHATCAATTPLFERDPRVRRRQGEGRATRPCQSKLELEKVREKNGGKWKSGKKVDNEVFAFPHGAQTFKKQRRAGNRYASLRTVLSECCLSSA